MKELKGHGVAASTRQLKKFISAAKKHLEHVITEKAVGHDGVKLEKPRVHKQHQHLLKDEDGVVTLTGRRDIVTGARRVWGAGLSSPSVLPQGQVWMNHKRI